MQFRAGTTLEDAHAIAHLLQHAIQARLRNADVLIHLEPAGPRPTRHGDLTRRDYRRLIAADRATTISVAPYP